MRASERPPRVGWYGEKLRPARRYEELTERARKARDWTLEKLAIWDYYVGYGEGGFLRASQRAPRRYVVDGYAGCGLVKAGKGGPPLDGSPIIALEAACAPGTDARGLASDGQVRFTRGFFVEKNLHDAVQLQTRLRRYPKDRVWFKQGDFNALASEIFGQIHPRAPTIAFLDLEDLDDLDFDTLRMIASRPFRSHKVELFITLPIGWLLPRVEPNDLVRHVSRLIGVRPEDVRGLFGRYSDPEAIKWDEVIGQLRDLFLTQLQSELGYRYVLCQPLPRRRPLYHLVFATDHEAGARIMRAAFNPDTRRRRELQGRLPF